MLGLQQTRNVNPILLYCCPASQTMVQHYNKIGRTSPVYWELVNVLWRTRNIHLIIARTSVRAKSSQRPEWGCWTSRPMLQDLHFPPSPSQPQPLLTPPPCHSFWSCGPSIWISRRSGVNGSPRPGQGAGGPPGVRSCERSGRHSHPHRDQHGTPVEKTNSSSCSLEKSAVTAVCPSTTVQWQTTVTAYLKSTQLLL